MTLRQDRVLGALLGMGIGDALGMPVEGWTREHVAERFGRVDTYHPRTYDDGASLAAGEFTDDSEGVLCIVEAYTASTGELDPDAILARLEILARGEAKRWMNPVTLEAITTEGDRSRHRVTGDVAARGIPLGLIAVGSTAATESFIEATAAVLAELTHTDSLARQAIAVVAEGVRLTVSGTGAGRLLVEHLIDFGPGGELRKGLRGLLQLIEAHTSYDDIAAHLGFGDSAEAVVLSAVAAAAMATDYESGVTLAVSQGGAADSRGAIAGALLGGQYGTAGIPQRLIDGLEGRMYIMLAAPWLFQTIQLKTAWQRQR